MFDHPNTDLTKSVMTDESGCWHIIPAEYVDKFVSRGRESVVVHACPQWTEDTYCPVQKLPWAPLGYWSKPEHMEAPCKLCLVPVPESIANLFMLHNFDTFARNEGFDIGEAIHRAVNRVCMHQEHKVFISALKPARCPCEECHVKYGAWK